MSTLQVTQNTARFPVTYDNSAKNIKLDSINLQELEKKAIKAFKEKKPNYRVNNLRTDLLTKRVVDELKSQVNKDKITLTNGCCTLQDCPTTTFIGCVFTSINSD